MAHVSSPAERARNSCGIWRSKADEVIRLDGLLNIWSAILEVIQMGVMTDLPAQTLTCFLQSSILCVQRQAAAVRMLLRFFEAAG